MSGQRAFDAGTPRLRLALPLLLLVGILLALVRRTAVPLPNPDTYFHLRFGREFLAGWSPSDPGSVSSFATADWRPTQWLSQVVMAAGERTFGLPGVAWLSGLLLLALTFALYVATRRRADPIAAVPVTALALIACGPALGMRPQVLSFVLSVVVVSAWLRAQDDHRVRWWLVPATWLWAMLHGMWPLALVIGGCAVLGMALDGGLPRRRLAAHAAVPLLSAAAAFLTPVGPGLVGAVVGVGSRREFFVEWGPPSLLTPAGLGFAVLFAALLASELRGPRTPAGRILWILLALALAAYSARTLPLAALLIAPLTAAALQQQLPVRRPPGRGEQAVVGTSFAGSLLLLAFLVPHTSADPPGQPDWMDPALGSLPAGTPVLNETVSGGYLMWRFPQLDLVMHGYGDTFTIPELRRNARILTLEPGWQDLVAETGVRYAVLDPETPLAHALVRSEGWQVLHRSAEVELLGAPGVAR